MIGGRLDRRITVQSKSEAIDAYGQRTLTWSTHLTVWANFFHKTGKEQEDSSNRSTMKQVEFRTRYHSTITNEMRILYDSEYYKIEDIKEIQRQDGLIIICTKLNQT